MARLCGHKKVVFTLAGLGSLFAGDSLLKKIITPLFRYAFRHDGAHVIFQNPDDFNVMKKAGLINPDRSTLIKSSGVDLLEFSFSNIQNTDKPIILFSSRLIRAKGVEDFVEAARLFKGKARFQIAGDVYDKNPESLSHEEVQAWNDAGIVEWLGQVSDMPSTLKSCTIFVLPSYYREGVPKVIIEAMATGRPVITCDTPGCRETVKHGENGLLIPPQNPAALVKAIQSLLDDPSKMEDMGAKGRAIAEKEFSVESVVSRTLEVYDRAIKNG